MARLKIFFSLYPNKNKCKAVVGDLGAQLLCLRGFNFLVLLCFVIYSLNNQIHPMFHLLVRHLTASC